MEPYKKILILTFLAMAIFVIVGGYIPEFLGLPLMSGAVIFFGPMLIFGIGLIVMGMVYSKMRRTMENIPTSKINSIAMGLVEIFGKVCKYSNKILESPFSLTDCIYYKYVIKQYKGTREGIEQWKTLKEEIKNTLFCLQDETGTVLIDPKDAKVEIDADYNFLSKPGADPPEHIQNFLKSINIDYKGFLGRNKRILYSEYVIKPDDKIYIMGTAKDNPYKEDGTAQKGVEDILISKGPKESLFYISDKSEGEILKSHSSESKMLYIFGGFIVLMSLMVILSSVL